MAKFLPYVAKTPPLSSVYCVHYIFLRFHEDMSDFMKNPVIQLVIHSPIQ